MPQDPNHSLREHLVELLTGGHAHAKFEDAIKGLPPNSAAPSLPTSRTQRG